MLKRTLYFVNPVHLSVRYDQLVIKLKIKGEKDKAKDEEVDDDYEHTVPIEDIGFMVLENPQITFTMRVIESCNDRNVAVLFCNHRHHPAAMLQNLDGNNIHCEVVRLQSQASQTLKKNLWKQVVIAKIRNQAALLRSTDRLGSVAVSAYTSKVKSGDPTNMEGAFARLYWKHLVGDSFIRDRHGYPPNHLFNYGYIILRAAVARAITASGMLPVFGIYHRGRYNAYCLADDLMEPYRPYVDKVAMERYKDNPQSMDVTREDKQHLMNVLTMDVVMGELKRPLMVALSSTTASLAACFQGTRRKLELPQFG